MTDPPLQAFTRFIAIDIHKHSLMIGGSDAQQRIVLPPRKVELHRWLDWAAANLDTTDAVVLEATTNAWTIYDQVVKLVGRAVVVHLAKVKLIAEARVKTDRVDVLTLAKLLRADMLPEVWVPPTHVRNLRYGLQDLPTFPTPSGQDAGSYLAQLCQKGCAGATVRRPSACRQLAYELSLIARAGLANHFLIVWNIIRFARTHGIRCQGCGSAANSITAYVLGICPIDPLAHDLVFERFLSDERPALPDIDIDFAADRREEVIQYVYEWYGRDHAAMACTLITFQARSATRDIAAVLDSRRTSLHAPSSCLTTVEGLAARSSWSPTSATRSTTSPVTSASTMAG